MVLALGSLGLSGCGKETIDLDVAQSTARTDGGPANSGRDGSARDGAAFDANGTRSCSIDAECVPGDVCVVEKHRCGECVDSSQCSRSRLANQCDPSTNQCVGCVDNADCSQFNLGFFGIQLGCDAIRHSCGKKCTSSIDCVNLSGSSVPCQNGICVECQVDGDCVIPSLRCFSGQCAECSLDADCSAPTPHCRHRTCLE